MYFSHESFGHFGRGTTQAQVLGDLLRMVINHGVQVLGSTPPNPQDAGSSPPGNSKKTFLGDLGISTETFISHEQSHIGSRVHSLKLTYPLKINGHFLLGLFSGANC